MSSILLTLQFILAAILVIAVLLQKSQSMGLGAYSGSNESLFGAKGPAGFLAKFTFVLGLVFVVNTLALGYVYNQSLRTSVVSTEAFKKSAIPAAEQSVSDAPDKNATPSASPVDINATK